jgi:hypothetical protein
MKGQQTAKNEQYGYGAYKKGIDDGKKKKIALRTTLSQVLTSSNRLS